MPRPKLPILWIVPGSNVLGKSEQLSNQWNQTFRTSVSR
jgi:hypothetical protein